METTDVRPEFLSYEQGRQLTGLSRQAIWRAIRSGEIEAFRVGRKVKISRTSLEEYIRRDPVEAK
jgi:excisionase family DNA binding protein